MRRFSPQRVREARTRSGKTREVVATEIRRSYQAVSFYERGVVVPPTRVLEDLAFALGCEPGDFFEDEPIAAVVTA
ncbi:MAG: helix-turn-helix domain-containing protein [Actinomycetota bacterium]|nr:helix-turn-helix domain-containing protein [Actinomycetota bacterium]